MPAPRFSVIIPVYNRAKTVGPTLQSVRGQTFRDFECIVVDDGSADGEVLRAVVEGLADPRFRYVRRDNGGESAARNTGIDEAKGEFIAFLDSDDRWLPEKLRIQSNQLTGSSKTVAYCQAYVDRGVAKRWVRPSRGLHQNENIGEYLFVANEFVQSSTIALPSDLAKSVRWDSSLAKGQDLDFVLRLHQVGAKFEYWPEPLVIWHDVVEEGRTSRATGAAHSQNFLAKHRQALTRRARRGFLVTYLAYDLAHEQPLKAFVHLAAGAATGVPLGVVGRQFLRSFLPRGFYRKLVNRFVSIGGVR
jgi:glycosyltransferase involved in cell wall biosynthesis